MYVRRYTLGICSHMYTTPAVARYIGGMLRAICMVVHDYYYCFHRHKNLKIAHTDPAHTASILTTEQQVRIS